ncbi:hypothetical protein E2C01_085754 [Portunus trituberculatus]|uniref:Uncharacterized protein n=1 Tax=Portunus trituberculatus TaxID=210409 RepID=A0A5B7J9R1_PORTR|nr:hypothetical protein [Portunus trituberculatus]
MRWSLHHKGGNQLASPRHIAHFLQSPRRATRLIAPPHFRTIPHSHAIQSVPLCAMSG